MRKLMLLTVSLLLCAPFAFAQTTSFVYFNGETPADLYLWTWGFTQEPGPVMNMGYTPGTSAIQWAPYDNGGYQGIFIGLSSNVGVDMTGIWETDSLHFKLKAPAGLDPADPSLNVVIYDSRNSDWDHSVYFQLDSFHDLDDTNWHSFSLALKDFQQFSQEIDKTDIVAVSFEYFDTGISSEFFIDHVWIGKPELPITMVLFDGQSLVPGVSFEAWGFENNDLTLAEGEGYTPGTPAIVWETSNWDWQGMGFIFEPQDFSYAMTVDTVKLKIKAPAGIHDLALEFYDVNYYSTYAVARKVLDDVNWDGNWQSLKVALADFAVDGSFDVSKIMEFGVVAADTTISERLLLDEIWIGNPSVSIDIMPPPAPENVTVTEDPAFPHVNYITWNDIDSEHGETYDVYASMSPITDLAGAGVFQLAADVAEGNNIIAHSLYYPLRQGDVTYYYAVTCTDAAGNVSETFTAAPGFTNTGRAWQIMNFGAPENFVLDGYFDEWAGIAPFSTSPEHNPVVSGSIDDSLDFSAKCYLAIDNEFLYVAFDIVDDVFSWRETNTVDWWNDESIEFFIGLYPIAGNVSHHATYWGRGVEPDYRIVFRPDRLTIDAWPNVDSLMAGTENYYFESGGGSDYFIEAKIPLAVLAGVSGDSSFTPQDGMKIPFEVQYNDADIVDGGEVARIQLGDNSTDDGWWNNPDVWTFTWIGMPEWAKTAVEQYNPGKPASYFLDYNYPNPFNPTTTIRYGIKNPGNVKLTIYNSLGQKVATLVNKYQQAGEYSIDFDASKLASGIYLYKISAGDFTGIKKMLLLR